MSFFFWKHKQVKPPQVELVSVHIPKTAGTSFRNTLKKIYGEKEVIRLDISAGTKAVKLNEKPYEHGVLPDYVRVVHGHFHIKDLYSCFPELEPVPVITWLRHPVKRTISNYYYLLQQTENALETAKINMGAFKHLRRSLEEYASQPANKNRMSRILEGKKIDDFLFVGLVEEYEKDLELLGKILNWKTVPHIVNNVTSRKQEVNRQEILDLILEYNKQDVELYNYILSTRTPSNQLAI